VQTASWAGYSLGVVLTNLLSGLLAKHLGWPWVFYLLAVFFVPWCVLWAAFVADDPSKCKAIPADELAFIQKEQGKDLDAGLGKVRTRGPLQ